MRFRFRYFSLATIAHTQCSLNIEEPVSLNQNGTRLMMRKRTLRIHIILLVVFMLLANLRCFTRFTHCALHSITHHFSHIRFSFPNSIGQFFSLSLSRFAHSLFCYFRCFFGSSYLMLSLLWASACTYHRPNYSLQKRKRMIYIGNDDFSQKLRREVRCLREYKIFNFQPFARDFQRNFRECWQ